MSVPGGVAEEMAARLCRDIPELALASPARRIQIAELLQDAIDDAVEMTFEDYDDSGDVGVDREPAEAA